VKEGATSRTTRVWWEEPGHGGLEGMLFQQGGLGISLSFNELIWQQSLPPETERLEIRKNRRWMEDDVPF